MNITQLSEHLKDIPQNTLVGYAQNPNSVVPQFLALAEIQRRQQLEAPAQAPASTVANDVLARANPQPAPMAPQQMAPQQMPQQGIAQMARPAPQQIAQQLPENQPGVAQLPSGMPQGMAAGGIVAFARGGLNLSLADEESTETEDEELARLFPVDDSRMRYLSSYVPEGVQAGIQGLMAKMPQSYEATKKAQASAPSKEVSGSDASRQYNVGNLRPVGFTYPGQVGVSKGGFAMFDKPESGIAALHQDIGIKLNRGLDTPMKFISVYAPAADKNDVKAYSSNVGKMLGIGPNDKIPNTPEARQLLAKAIIKQEGSQYATTNFAKGGAVPRFAGEGLSLVGPSGEPMEDFLERNPSEPKPEKTLTESEKARARDIAKTEEALRKNAARAAEMQAPKKAPIASGLKPPPANFAEAPVGKINKLLGATLLPYGVFEGGKRATESAMSTIAPQVFSATREQLMGSGGGDDTALAAAIMQNADYTKPDSSFSKALRNNPISNYLFGTSGDSPVAPQPKASVAAPTAAPAAPNVENPFAPAAPVTPAQQSAQDKYFELASKQIEDAAANLAKQGKMNAALSVLNAGLGMLKSKSPYFLGGVGEGGQEGVSTFASLNKQQNEGLKDLMAARLGLAKTGASAGYANEMLGLRRVDIARDNLQRYVDKRMAEVLAMPGGAMNKDYATAKAAIFKDPVYIQLARDAQVPYNEAAAPGPAGPRKEPLGAFQK
jgi:hypothetical protein